MVLHSDFNYTELKYRIGLKEHDRNRDMKLANVIITFDTETSKLKPNPYIESIDKYIAVPNYVVTWSVCIRYEHSNIVTLYGFTPTEMAECLDKIQKAIDMNLIIYAHNLSYDWQFTKHALFKVWGYPTDFLATKTHNPINIKFKNGVQLRDSYILAQRSLEKWTEDLNVEHKKAVGKWDYNKIRTQHEEYTEDELEYTAFDVVGLAECIDKIKEMWLGEDGFLSKMPYTATGKIRADLMKHIDTLDIREDAKAHFKKLTFDYDRYQNIEHMYHGGYTHANRFHVGELVKDEIIAYDFASSYPYCMIAKKFPCSKFKKNVKLEGVVLSELLEKMPKDYTVIGTVIITNGCVCDNVQMPYLQESKCHYQLYKADVNVIVDNGRVLEWTGDIAIDCTDISMRILEEQYEYDEAIVTNVRIAKMDYLPNWFRDFVWQKWQAKCELKGGDPVLYAIAKSEVNSLYGMCVQKAVQDDIVEDYETGEYCINPIKDDELLENTIEQIQYEKAIKKYRQYQLRETKILPYIWGVYITEWAVFSLFEMGKLAGTWLYSDTDSCYGIDWNNEKLEEYNKSRIQELERSGYGVVTANGKDFYLGVAELDGIYSEFVTLGCKRYCARYSDKWKKCPNEIKLVVSGVPKINKETGESAKEWLKDDLSNFKKGFVFTGEMTGKKTKCYGYTDFKNIDGKFWFDLIPCNYLLDEAEIVDRVKKKVAEIQELGNYALVEDIGII